MVKKRTTLSPEEIVKRIESENPENFKQEEETADEQEQQQEEDDKKGTVPFNARGVYKDENGNYKLEEKKPVSGQQETLTNNMLSGYKIIPIEQLPSRGLFYKDDFHIGIKAAKVGEIREWSVIDENDPLSISEKINMIMERCVRVSSSSGIMAWGDICEIDRTFILVRLHELTFPDGENSLMIPFKCDGCGYETQLPLNSSMCSGLFDPSDAIMKFYDAEQKCFVIRSEKLSEPIALYPPTLGVSNIVQKKAQQMRMEGVTEDPNMKESMIRCLQFFMPNWRQWTDEKFGRFNMNMLNWSNYKFQVVNWFINEFNKCNKFNAVTNCERCGEDVSHPIFFRGGFGLKEFFCQSFNPDELF